MRPPTSRQLRFGTALLALAGVAADFVASPQPPASLALLKSATNAGSNAFTTAADWHAPVVTAQVVGLASDTRTGGYVRRGSQLYVYANVVDSGAPASGTTVVTANVGSLVAGASAVPLVAGTYAFPAGGTAYAYRSALLTSSDSLTPGVVTWSITTHDAGGNVGVTTFQATVSTTYGFGGGATHVGTNCLAGSGGQYDMELGAVGAGSEASRTGPGPFDRVTFCSDTFSAGATIPGGDTTVTLTYQNTSANKTCDVTATLWRNATSLGSGGQTIPVNRARTSGTWVFSTNSATFAAGDRLVVTVDYKTGNQCNGTTIFWNSTAAPSSVTIP